MSILQTVRLGTRSSNVGNHAGWGEHSRLASLDVDTWPLLANHIGSIDVLSAKTLGIVCSVRLPGSVILETFDFAKAVCREGIAVVGGFHSPLERQCLEILLVRHVPLVICPGRRLSSARVPSAWRAPLDEGRLLLLSPFAERSTRVTRELAYQRNRFVMELSDALLVPFAAPGGRTVQIAREAVARKKDIWSFGMEAGEELFSLGVRQTTARELVDTLGTHPPQTPRPPRGGLASEMYDMTRW